MTQSPYRWLHRLGAGSAGVVWAADRDGVRLAVKVLRTHSVPSLTETIQREMRIGPMIADHPNIVGVRRVVDVGGVLHLEMDLVRGPNLAQVLEARIAARRGAVPLAIAVAWMADVLDALAWVGRIVAPAAPTSFCHRDIKPANLLLDPTGIVRVTDFGVARATAELGFQTTATGVVKGSPRFMAPEVIAERAPDASADQFSVAVVLFELITGVPLYEGRDLPEVLMLAVQADVDRRLQIVRGPDELVRVMRKMLARLPTDRYPRLEDAASALRAVRLSGATLREVLPELLSYAPDLSDDAPSDDNGVATRELALDESGATDPHLAASRAGFLGPPNRTLQARALPTFQPGDDHPTRPHSFDELRAFAEPDATTDVSELLSDVTPALDELPGPPLSLRPTTGPLEPSEPTPRPPIALMPPLQAQDDAPTAVARVTPELAAAIAASNSPAAPRPFVPLGSGAYGRPIPPAARPGTDTEESTPVLQASELPTQVLRQAEIDVELRRMLEDSPPRRSRKEAPPARTPGVEIALIAFGAVLFVAGSAGAVLIVALALAWNAR